MTDGNAQVEVCPTCLYPQRVDAAHNMRRFYRMTIQRDLFRGASLVRVWGRIGKRGHQLVNIHADEGRAITALMKLAHEKRCRGYDQRRTGTGRPNCPGRPERTKKSCFCRNWTLSALS